MKTNYFILLLSIIAISCNNQQRVEGDEKKISVNKKSKKFEETPESTYINNQISRLEFQVEAFKIGSEKVASPDLKKYLNDEIDNLKELLSQTKSLAITNNYEIKPISKELQDNLYKLVIGDVKGFDNVFILYYKDFLSKSLDDIAVHKFDDLSVNQLKDKYGNLLYNHKLYFDVQK